MYAYISRIARLVAWLVAHHRFWKLSFELLGWFMERFHGCVRSAPKVRVSRVQGGAVDNHAKISGLSETEPSRSQRYGQVHP